MQNAQITLKGIASEAEEMSLNSHSHNSMIEDLFNIVFNEVERVKIRSRGRSEPWETMRKAWILFAYFNDFSLYDIAWCTHKNRRQTRYLLERAEDLYSINDREIHKLILEYEATLGKHCNTSSEANR